MTSIPMLTFKVIFKGFLRSDVLKSLSPFVSKLNFLWNTPSELQKHSTKRFFISICPKNQYYQGLCLKNSSKRQHFSKILSIPSQNTQNIWSKNIFSKKTRKNIKMINYFYYFQSLILPNALMEINCYKSNSVGFWFFDALLKFMNMDGCHLSVI